ncbi:VOC family protein [Stappia indica]|uniref:VOC family protein n=1 Tax=Stappia indica TaxID=538381 RepID=UPI0008298587|nr:VOC family protein [Stappia indica]
MTVRRIVANIAVTDTGPSTAFYRDILDLEPVMDHGWIVTLAAAGASPARPQIGIATQGGSGTPVPDLSIEVDDLDTVIVRIERAGLRPEYGPVSEPWGVRRLFLRDPSGRLLNILEHAGDE